MKIQKATNAFKIATVKYVNSTKLDFIYEKELMSQDGETSYPQRVLTENVARRRACITTESRGTQRMTP